MRASLEYFIDTVIRGKKVETATIEQGRDAVLLVEAGIKSANESRYLTKAEMKRDSESL